MIFFKQKVRFFSTNHEIIILCPYKKLIINLSNTSTAEESPFLICSKMNSPINCTGVVLETEGIVRKIQKGQDTFSLQKS